MPQSLRSDQYYNADGTLDSFYNWDGQNTIYQSYGYAYNADHQIIGYNALGHLTSDTRTDNYAHAKTYSVDGAGNRLSMNENGQVSRAVNGALTGYYLDGSSILEEEGPAGTVQYTWGNGLVRRESEYPLTDGQGTTKLETNASKSVTSTQETEAFGRSIGGTGSTGSPFGYHGGDGYRSDGDGPAGLEPYQKVGARYYDATFGRFLTRDTDLSQSPYAYCDGDPVNLDDPTGHESALPGTFETTGSSGVIEFGGDGPGGVCADGGGSDPGNNPTPQVPPASGGGTFNTGSGILTVAPSGVLTYTQGGESVGVLPNPQNFAVTESGIAKFGNTSVTFNGGYNFSTGVSTAGIGLSYTTGGVSFSVSSKNGGTAALSVGAKF